MKRGLAPPKPPCQGFRLQEICRARRPRCAVLWRRGGFHSLQQLRVKESPSHGYAVPAPFNKGAFGAGPGPSSTQAPLAKGGRAAGCNPVAGGFRNPKQLQARDSLSHRLRRRQLPQRGSLSRRRTKVFLQAGLLQIGEVRFRTLLPLPLGEVARRSRDGEGGITLRQMKRGCPR